MWALSVDAASLPGAHQWRTVPDAGGPRLFKIAQAVSGLPDRREFGSQSRSFFSREGRR
jgi:hypothetical protein